MSVRFKCRLQPLAINCDTILITHSPHHTLTHLPSQLMHTITPQLEAVAMTHQIVLMANSHEETVQLQKRLDEAYRQYIEERGEKEEEEQIEREIAEQTLRLQQNMRSIKDRMENLLEQHHNTPLQLKEVQGDNYQQPMISQFLQAPEHKRILKSVKKSKERRRQQQNCPQMTSLDALLYQDNPSLLSQDSSPQSHKENLLL